MLIKKKEYCVAAKKLTLALATLFRRPEQQRNTPQQLHSLESHDGGVGSQGPSHGDSTLSSERIVAQVQPLDSVILFQCLRQLFNPFDAHVLAKRAERQQARQMTFIVSSHQNLICL
jgi:hypothetical protein